LFSIVTHYAAFHPREGEIALTTSDDGVPKTRYET
jgi:hypothetical protein